MTGLWLRVRAPFAAFRWMQAGVYRATSPIIPPSAAWGLVLNLAHVETRDTTRDAPVTGVNRDAPALQLAVGQIGRSETATLYQQLHSYPVGASGKTLAKRTHGAKYWIAPVRRELLVGLDCLVGVRGDPALLDRVIAGLRGQLDVPRYGLPFAGDNNFLLDRIDVLDHPCPARWYARVAHDAAPPRTSCRLTVAIDRKDSSNTLSPLFAPTDLVAQPPDSAWIWCPHAPASSLPAQEAD